MTIIMKAALAALLVLVCTVPTDAGESAFPDIQRILDNQKLLVAILARDAPPMIMTDAHGAVIGAEVDLALDIGKKMGVAVEFLRTAKTYDDVVDIVAQKEADMAVSFLSSGASRAKKVLFSQPYVIQNRRIFYNRALFAGLRRDYKIKTLEQVPTIAAEASLEFGVLEGSIYEDMLAQDLPQFQPKLYQRLPEIVTAVKEGRIFAGLHGELGIEFYMREHPETAIYIAVKPKVRHPSDICIAVRPDAPNLMRWVNIYLTNHVGLLETADVIERFKKAHAKSK